MSRSPREQPERTVTVRGADAQGQTPFRHVVLSAAIVEHRGHLVGHGDNKASPVNAPAPEEDLSSDELPIVGTERLTERTAHRTGWADRGADAAAALGAEVIPNALDRIPGHVHVQSPLPPASSENSAVTTSPRIPVHHREGSEQRHRRVRVNGDLRWVIGPTDEGPIAGPEAGSDSVG